MAPNKPDSRTSTLNCFRSGQNRRNGFCRSHAVSVGQNIGDGGPPLSLLSTWISICVRVTSSGKRVASDRTQDLIAK